MHFKGAFNTLTDITSADPGDIIILSGTSKEYVYNIGGDAYAVSNWVELGDESTYASIAEVVTLSTNLEGVMDSKDGELSTSLEGVMDTKDIELCANIKNLISSDSKIFVDGLSTQSLSIIHIDQSDFYQKVVESSIMSNALYLISGTYINAYGRQIKYVAEPSLSDDAVTKNYVDEKFVQVEIVNESCTVSSNTVTTFTPQSDLSFYFSILPVEQSIARNMKFVVDCGQLNNAPSIIWP